MSSSWSILAVSSSLLLLSLFHSACECSTGMTYVQANDYFMSMHYILKTQVPGTCKFPSTNCSCHLPKVQTVFVATALGGTNMVQCRHIPMIHISVVTLHQPTNPLSRPTRFADPTGLTRSLDPRSLRTTCPSQPWAVGSRDPTRSVCPAHSKSFARVSIVVPT